MNQNALYYLDRSSNSVGPFSLDDLVDHLEANQYDDETLVWHEGLPDWIPLRDVETSGPNGSNEYACTPVESPALPKTTTLHSYNTYSPVPWRRWFARFVDLSIFGNIAVLVMMFLLGFVSSEAVVAISTWTSDPLFDGAVLLLVWCPFECLLLAKYGTTPGKLLFGLKVHGKDGSMLPFNRLVERYLGMTVYGMGCGVYLVVLFTYILSYRRLMSTKTTKWDEAAESHVVATPWTVGRSVICVFMVVSALMFVALIRVYLNKEIS
jgi:uncharacterized RDD family membrane protein YckC